MGLKWTKKLTRSDAQQRTQGSKMPFLRFVKGSVSHDHTKWFRNVFFDGLNWNPAKSVKGNQIEAASVDVKVEILGNDLGVRKMRLDHDPSRAANHRAPTTHLHYDTKTRSLLESMKLAGRTVEVVRDNAGAFFLRVS